MSIPILMYHEVVDERPSEYLLKKVQSSYLVSRYKFKEQIAYLKESGFYTISLHEAINVLENRKKIAEKAIVITFDDGFEGNYYHALPILKEYDFTATFFIAAGLVGKSNMLSWDQICEMNKEGMSMQSHTVTHPLLSTKRGKEVKYELMESKLIIEKAIGSSVNFLSYPNGDYNSEVIVNLRNLGYRAACSSKFGLNNTGTDAFELKRIKISSSYTLEDFKKIMSLNKKMHFLLKTKDSILSSVRKILGPNNYEKIYFKVFNLKP